MQGKGNAAPRRKHNGLEERHQRRCASNSGRRCNCTSSWRAEVYDRRIGKKHRATFATQAAAKRWQADARSQLNRGRRIDHGTVTVREYGEMWVAGATASPPLILNRSGRTYKPSVLRGYEGDLRNYVYPDLGGRRLGEIARRDLQALVDRLVGAGHSDSKVRNVLMPLRAIYRHALERDEIAVNPTSNLRLPTGLGVRDRVATVDEAEQLLAALPAEDRAVWATAFYAGLRLGELQALRRSDINLAGGTIAIARGWDAKAGTIDPKTEKGKRVVPIAALLHDYLVDHVAAIGTSEDALVFATRPGQPFTPSWLRKRARRAWDEANERRAEADFEPLQSIGFHECRHTCVTLFFEAGLTLEQIGDYIGHSTKWMTDHYRHLLSDHLERSRKLLDDYFARANTGARLEQLDA